MRLTFEQAMHVADQLQGQAIPEEHPNTPQLREAIGDHTFFLNNDGLHIVEPNAEAPSEEEGSAVRIASWSRDQEGQLFLHEPEATQAVSLKPSGPDVA